MAEPKFLTFQEVCYLHDVSLAKYGGIAGIGSVAQVESAIGAAENTFWFGHGDLFAIAAAYALHIAEAQAFNDGNKRAAAAAAIAFLVSNGVQFPEDDGSVYDALIDIANKRLDKPGLAIVLRKLVEKQN